MKKVMLQQFASKWWVYTCFIKLSGVCTKSKTPKVLVYLPVLREWRVGEKISLDNDQWQWVVDCVRQPKKSNEQFDLPVRGGKFELDL